MSSVLYYSNYCSHSKKIIGKLARTMTKKEVHFIQCFVCPNFQSRVMGNVLCKGDTL